MLEMLLQPHLVALHDEPQRFCVVFQPYDNLAVSFPAHDGSDSQESAPAGNSHPPAPRPTPPHTPDRPAGPPTGAPRPLGRSGQLGTVPSDAPVASTPPGRPEPGGWARSAAFGPGAKKVMGSTDIKCILFGHPGRDQAGALEHPLGVTGAGSTAPGPL